MDTYNDMSLHNNRTVLCFFLSFLLFCFVQCCVLFLVKLNLIMLITQLVFAAEIKSHFKEGNTPLSHRQIV